MDLLERLQARGAVHQVFHENEDADQPEIAICNCCWDCCGLLGSYNRGILPLHFRSYFEARMSDAGLCDGCGTCADFCPVQAISLVGQKAQVDVRKCIGCGQCSLQCPQGAVGLVPHERNVILPLVKPSHARLRGQATQARD
jgi:ferredoxin